MKDSKVSIELLSHFSCRICNKWWSISDAPKEKKEWFCPWCGEKQVFVYKNEI